MPTMEWVAGDVPAPLPLPAPIELAVILAPGQPSLAADAASSARDSQLAAHSQNPSRTDRPELHRPTIVLHASGAKSASKNTN